MSLYAKLKPFQKTVVDKNLYLIEQTIAHEITTSGRQVTVSPTGSGKTFMMAAIIEIALEYKQEPIFVWVTHNRQILSQTECEIMPHLKNVVSVYDIEHGIERYGARVLLMNVQKGSSKKAKIWIKKWVDYHKVSNSPIVFIIDEADEGMSGKHMAGLQKILKPTLELGFTASFKKKPGEFIYHNVSFKEVIEAEMLVETIYYNASEEVTRSEMLLRAIAQRNELEKIAITLQANDPSRFFVPKLLIQTSARYCEDMARDLQHTLNISDEQLHEQAVVHTENSRGLDEIDDLAKVRYIIGDFMVERGWNCPEAYVLLSLKQTVSKARGIQLLGRVIRLPKAKRFPAEYGAFNAGYVYISGKHSIEESCKNFGNELPVLPPPQEVQQVEKLKNIIVPPMLTYTDELVTDVESDSLIPINTIILNVIEQFRSKCAGNLPEIRTGQLNLIDTSISINPNKSVEVDWNIELAKSMLIDALATQLPRNYSNYLITKYQIMLRDRGGLNSIAPAVKEICSDIKISRVIKDISLKLNYASRQYEWPPHKLVLASPRPLHFQNALYNKMQLNSEESDFAVFLENICSKNNLHWVRNDPSNIKAFKGHTPDFIIFSESNYIFIEFKGKHLLSTVDSIKKNFRGQMVSSYYMVYIDDDTNKFILKGTDGEIDQPFTDIMITSILL